MKAIAIAALGLALGLAAPAAASALPATGAAADAVEMQRVERRVIVRPGRVIIRRPGFVRPPRCRLVEVRRVRPNGTVVIRQTRRCF